MRGDGDRRRRGGDGVLRRGENCCLLAGDEYLNENGDLFLGDGRRLGDVDLRRGDGDGRLGRPPGENLFWGLRVAEITFNLINLVVSWLFQDISVQCQALLRLTDVNIVFYDQ